MAADPVPASDWRSIYRRYTALERQWRVEGAEPPLARQFFHRIVHGGQREAAIIREFGHFRLDPPARDMLDEAFFLQHALEAPDRPDGRHADQPLEDVYAAALSMLPHGFWIESPDRSQLYRGQRNSSWRTVPSFFRQDAVDAAMEKLALAVGRVRRCGLDLDDDQAVALAQHYSKELGVTTWLLDVTWDPRVALFFATDGATAGDVGVVSCIVRKEWDDLSVDGTNRLGPLRVIDVPGALRIERQRASFLDTSHPDLLDQYVAHTVWFRQHDGLVFEDLDADHPVGRDLLYPAVDPVLEKLQGVADAEPAVLRAGPAGDARAPLSSADYLEIALSWCRQAGVDIDAYREDTLRVVCDVYAQLQRRRDDFSITARSLLRLQEAVEFVMNAQRAGQFMTPHRALEWTLSRLPPAAREQVADLITECAAARDLC